ncbi:MAG: right-handed parallel beta-helix repeat-containing protein [Hyphomicrobiaceae bacterium]
MTARSRGLSFGVVVLAAMAVVAPKAVPAQTPVGATILIAPDGTQAASDAAGTASTPASIAHGLALLEKEPGQRVTLRLSAGVYPLDEPIRLQGLRCGTSERAVIIEGASADAPPVLLGGTLLEPSRWQRWDGQLGTTAAPVLTATVPKGSVQQLYDLDTASGTATALPRARHPDIDPMAERSRISVAGWGYARGSYSVRLRTPSLPLWPDAQGFEIVAPIGWAVSRLRVRGYATMPDGGIEARLDRVDGSIELAKAARRAGGVGPFHKGSQHVWLEDHPAFLSSSGEWLHRPSGEAGVLYLVAGDEALLRRIVVPRLENLVTLASCRNTTLRNIALAGTRHSIDGGFIGVGGDQYYRWAESGGAPRLERVVMAGEAMLVENSTGVAIEGVRFSGIGGRAVRISGGSNVRIADSTFDEVGGTGLRIEHVRGSAAAPGAVVSGNRFRRIGTAYAGDAISVADVTFARIEGNELSNLAARALYVTDRFFMDSDKAAGTSSFAGNHVERPLRLVTDAGAINVSGGTGFVIADNILRDGGGVSWNRSGGFRSAVYLDIGAYRTSVTDNRIAGFDLAVNMNCQSDNEVSDNAVTGTRKRSSVSYAGCLLFNAAFAGGTAGPSFVHMRRTMQRSGCRIDQTGRTAACACNRPPPAVSVCTDVPARKIGAGG